MMTEETIKMIEYNTSLLGRLKIKDTSYHVGNWFAGNKLPDSLS